MSEAKQSEDSIYQEDKPVTMRVTGPGVVHVDAKELLQTSEVKRMLEQANKLVENSRRHSPIANQVKRLQADVDKIQQQLSQLLRNQSL